MNTFISHIIIKLKHLNLKTKIIIGFAAVLLIWFWLSLPKQLFNAPTSFVIEDEKGNLLSATTASDGQWRFPVNEDVPQKFAKCITTFEDKRFYSHPGVDPIAILRAVWQNLHGRKTISGGSTLTMQVMRLSRGRQRNIVQKIIEAIGALRLECSYSKREILALYAGNAPFGSNVVGLDAAAWRYFGRNPGQLSWGEMAVLAVLPNAPSVVHPGKNSKVLLSKRNRLLDKLYENKIIDKTTCELAKIEPLPGRPLPLPLLSPHLSDRFKKDYTSLPERDKHQSTKITSTLQLSLQQNVTAIIERCHNDFKGNGINNAAAMVMEVETGNVLAYVGNVYNPKDTGLESHVDVLASPRSPGSALKPILFAAMQSDGLLLPRQLVPDIPTQIGGYAPQNFNLEYDGAVPANRALSRSLNIPAVKMLQQYKYQRFYNVLQQCGFTTIKRPADYYGLSMILGGCEVTPWELAGVYSSMARAYLHQRKNKGRMSKDDWHMPVYVKREIASGNGEWSMVNDMNREAADNNSEWAMVNGVKRKTEDVKDEAIKAKRKTADVKDEIVGNSKIPQSQNLLNPTFLDYTSLWHMFNAMQEVMRPGEEGLWGLFNSAQRIAWKTGTSFGFRDGWAVGITPKYCVVVWVGNTGGEGRPGLTGINTAAPVLFDIFRLLPASKWFEPPAYDFAYLPICHESGFKAGPDCVDVDTVLISAKGVNASLCPYHRIIHLDRTATYRVNEGCEQPSAMLHRSWFVLPPGMEYYYRQRHREYAPLPPFMPGCSIQSNPQMELIYPEANAKIYVPVEISGEKGKTIFTAAHSNANAKIFWHLDDAYIGTTTQFHQIGLNPLAGPHTITLVDDQGERISRRFVILEKEKN